MHLRERLSIQQTSYKNLKYIQGTNPDAPVPICFACATAIYIKHTVFNKESSLKILCFCSYGIKVLTYTLYDEFIIKIAPVYAMVLSP